MEIAAAYRVRKAGTSADFHGIVPPRRGTSMSFPGLDWEKEDQVRKAMFDEWGLSEYRDCLTAEMPIRPIPHVFEASRVAPLTQVWRKYSPYLYHRIFRELRPTAQPFNKDSKLGWPFFTRPESKLRTLRPFFRSLMDEGAEIAKGGYITMNVRLQPERPDRDRDFNFLDGDGVPYSASATAELRTVETRIGKKISSRTRLVFNMPAPNLFKQILDSAIHAVLLKYPIFHHDLHSRGGTLPVHGVHVCADIAHFERTTAVIVRERGAMLGGLYGDITQVFADLPFLCPSRS